MFRVYHVRTRCSRLYPLVVTTADTTMWLTYTWVLSLVVALAAAGFHWLNDDWVSDPDQNTGKLYVRISVRSKLLRREFKDECEKIGGFLPEPKSKEENDFLKEMTGGMEFINWLGLTKKSGTWKWDQDGTRVEWFNWESRGERDCDCAMLKADGTWLGVLCEYQLPENSICEKGGPSIGINIPETTRKPTQLEIKGWETEPYTGKQYIRQYGESAVYPLQWEFQEKCKKIGGFLPEPKSQKESDYLAGMTSGATGSGVWLGMTKDNGIWKYHDGTTVDWFNWRDEKETENCGCVLMIITGKWQCLGCQRRAPSNYFCEKGGTPTGQNKLPEWITDTESGNQYIDLMTKGKPHAGNQEACKDIGAFLPEPKNKRENDFLARLDTSAAFRLGLRKRDGAWRWDRDSSEVSWTNWVQALVGHYQCAVTGHSDGSYDRDGWLDVGCTSIVGISTVVCQKEATKNPTKPEWITDTESGKQYIDLMTKGKPGGGNQEACKDIGAFLPEPKNKRENDFLASLETSAAFRLGLRKRDGAWRWDRDSSVVSWTNWVQALVGHYHCAVYTNDRNDGDGWLDVDCTSIVGISTIICEKGPAGGDWTTHPSTGKKYKVLKSQWKPTDGNQEACKNIGAVVAEPRNKDENDFLATLQPGTFRLGMSDTDVEGVWTWNSDGKQVVWFNWMKWAQTKNSEPNGGIDENCAVMLREEYFVKTGYNQKAWIDVDCASSLGTEVIICEKVEPDDAVGVAVLEYQLTVTLELKITNEDILNTGSDAFTDFAIELSQVMLKNYQSVNPAVVKVKVTGVRRGSTIVDHNVGVKANGTSADEIIATVVKESANLPIVINGTSYKQTIVNKGRVAAVKTNNGGGQAHPPALLMSVALGLCWLIHYM